MNESQRKAAMRDCPILCGFLGTLLQDSANGEWPNHSQDTIYTCPPATFKAAWQICRDFLAVEGVADMLEGEGDESAGADLYLTVAGHGAGFWDGDYGEHGDELTSAAHSVARYLESYIGDDGGVYIFGRESEGHELSNPDFQSHVRHYACYPG